MFALLASNPWLMGGLAVVVILVAAIVANEVYVMQQRSSRASSRKDAKPNTRRIRRASKKELKELRDPWLSEGKPILPSKSLIMRSVGGLGTAISGLFGRFRGRRSRSGDNERQESYRRPIAISQQLDGLTPRKRNGQSGRSHRSQFAINQNARVETHSERVKLSAWEVIAGGNICKQVSAERTTGASVLRINLPTHDTLDDERKIRALKPFRASSSERSQLDSCEQVVEQAYEETQLPTQELIRMHDERERLLSERIPEAREFPEVVNYEHAREQLVSLSARVFPDAPVQARKVEAEANEIHVAQKAHSDIEQIEDERESQRREEILNVYTVSDTYIDAESGRHLPISESQARIRRALSGEVEVVASEALSRRLRSSVQIEVESVADDTDDTDGEVEPLQNTLQGVEINHVRESSNMAVRVATTPSGIRRLAESDVKDEEEEVRFTESSAFVVLREPSRRIIDTTIID